MFLVSAAVDALKPLRVPVKSCFFTIFILQCGLIKVHTGLYSLSSGV